LVARSVPFLLTTAAISVVAFGLGYLAFTVGAGPWVIPVIAVALVLVASLVTRLGASLLRRRARGTRSGPS